MYNDYSKYNDEELLTHIEEVQTKLFQANPNYPAYQQLQDYIEDASRDRITLSMMKKDIEEGDQVIEIGEGEMQVDPDPIPEEEKEEMRKVAVTKLLAQSYVYNNKK